MILFVIELVYFMKDNKTQLNIYNLAERNVKSWRKDEEQCPVLFQLIFSLQTVENAYTLL